MQKTIQNILQNEIDPAYVKRASFIFETIEKYKPKKVLDAGCGRGFYVQCLSTYGFLKEIHGIELEDEYYKKAQANCTDPRAKITKGSLYKLPYKNNYFDAVICSEVLEHLTDEKKALKEIYRVLKPSGKFIVTVPNYNFPFLWDPINYVLMKLFDTHINKDMWWLAGLWAGHERLYIGEQLRKLLATFFSVSSVNQLTHWSWPFAHFFLYGIGKNIVERLGSKTFDRFSVSQKRGPATALAFLFSLPTKLDTYIPTKRSVNIVTIAQKKV